MTRIKRVYQAAGRTDGFRILVDRLWPRGLSKDTARVDLWLKEVAPSEKLRKWFAHDPERWQEFKKRYEASLGGKKRLLTQIKRANQEHRSVTLLFAARDTERNNAALLGILRGKEKYQ